MRVRVSMRVGMLGRVSLKGVTMVMVMIVCDRVSCRWGRKCIAVSGDMMRRRWLDISSTHYVLNGRRLTW
jgi:hypothetical protein